MRQRYEKLALAIVMLLSGLLLGTCIPKKNSDSHGFGDGSIVINDPDAPRGAPVPALPGGYEIWAVGWDDTRTWKTSARRIKMRTPDGDVEIGFMEDGAVEVRTFGIQSVRFFGGGGVGNDTLLEAAP